MGYTHEVAVYSNICIVPGRNKGWMTGMECTVIFPFVEAFMEEWSNRAWALYGTPKQDIILSLMIVVRTYNIIK